MAQVPKITSSIVSPRPARFYHKTRMPSLHLASQAIESPVQSEEMYGRLVDFLHPKPLESERSLEEPLQTSPTRSDRLSTLTGHTFKRPSNSPSVRMVNYPVFFSKSRRQILHKNLSEKQLALIKKIDPVKFEKTQISFKPKEKPKVREIEKTSNQLSKKSTFYTLRLKTPLSSERSSQYDGFFTINQLNQLRSPVLKTEVDNNVLRTKLSPLTVVSIKPIQVFRPTERQIKTLRRHINDAKTREASEEDLERYRIKADDLD